MGRFSDDVTDLMRTARRLAGAGDPGLVRLAAGILNDLRIEHERIARVHAPTTREFGRCGLTDDQIDEAAWHAAADDVRLDFGAIREAGGHAG